MIPRYSPPRIGQRTKDNNAARARVWQPILWRAGKACESCRRKDRLLEWSHIYGRPGSGLCLGVWANTFELTMALCVVRGTGAGCHTKLDRRLDPELVHRLHQQAMEWFAKRYDFDWGALAKEFDLIDPADMVRAMVRALEAEGRTPEGLPI